MTLGLENNEVRLVEYTTEWQKEFSRMKEQLLQATSLLPHQIEHVGSTAIHGMAAKPILDMVVGIDSIESVNREFLKALQSVGFLRLRVERPNEIVLAKFADDTYAVKTHYIHLVEYGGEVWHNLIFFRDYLNANEEARQQYLTIKLDYLKTSSSGIQEYTAFKEAFVQEIFEKRKID
ncbi:GrpB family protein [Chryseomicrobium sp. FSL W7-1435]|uniref:GrpB family protein n=1 Tax=Chryseomicrobium sp. FSL W7-1435 TaxID=2921704 RepID=UPI003159A44A